MRNTPRLTLLLLALVATAALITAGCGGSSGSESSGDDNGTVTEANGGASEDAGGESEGESGATDVDKSSPAYQGGYELCQDGPLEYVASLFGADPNEEAVADAVAEQVGGAGGEGDFAAGRQGCLDAFAASS